MRFIRPALAGALLFCLPLPAAAIQLDLQPDTDLPRDGTAQFSYFLGLGVGDFERNFNPTTDSRLTVQWNSVTQRLSFVDSFLNFSGVRGPLLRVRDWDITDEEELFDTFALGGYFPGRWTCCSIQRHGVVMGLASFGAEGVGFESIMWRPG